MPKPIFLPNINSSPGFRLLYIEIGRNYINLDACPEKEMLRTITVSGEHLRPTVALEGVSPPSTSMADRLVNVT